MLTAAYDTPRTKPERTSRVSRLSQVHALACRPSAPTYSHSLHSELRSPARVTAHELDLLKGFVPLRAADGPESWA